MYENVAQENAPKKGKTVGENMPKICFFFCPDAHPLYLDIW